MPNIHFSADSSGFVYIADAVPDVIQEMRYYTTYNFIGARIDGYESPYALLTRETADALRAASEDAGRLGYRFKLYDAYRPQSAVDHFVRWAQDADDQKMKAYFYPDLEKSELLRQGYIARFSAHSRGSAVDLTLLDMKTGCEADMGGMFDWFGASSHPDYTALSDLQLENRNLLQTIMKSRGFYPSGCEWWHFTLTDEPYPDTAFTFPIRPQ